MTCAACGMGDHRYGTTDPYHEPDRMACINTLRAENEQLMKLLAAILGPGLNAEQFHARYIAQEKPRRCLHSIDGIGGARLVCSLPEGHEDSHSDGVANWTPASIPPPASGSGRTP